MAEAAAASAVTGGWTRHVTCRYFMHGLCKEGDNCRYMHDLSSCKPTMTCRFFQKGCCTYGDRCRFEHTKPAKQTEAPCSESTAPFAGTGFDPASDGSGSTPGTLEKPHSVGAVDWVNAAEFVPGQPYCGRADPVLFDGSGPLIENEYEKELANREMKKQLCPYAAVGECRYGVNCAYLHGDICDMCGLQVLHPSDSSQRSQHIRACMEAHEKDMEISFAVQRSKDMMCGVCMEVVFEKSNPSERRFGILSNCSHCYCLKCIRKWRSAKQFENKIIKSCPECRITSNFVIPSEYWVEEKEEKQQLIQKYKDGMGSKPCRYFDEGRGTCPFGANCFYKHAFPDGRVVDPQPQRRQCVGRNRTSRRTALWDLFQERENGDSFDNEDEETVTFELREMLLVLLAAGSDDDVTDSEDEWDSFHEDLDDYYELYL